MTWNLAGWRAWATLYVAGVALAATLNAGEAPGGTLWYFAAVILTLPVSVFAIYPILFLAGIASVLTGGDYVGGNVAGHATVVLSFAALAAGNVAIARAICRFRVTHSRLGPGVFPPA